MKVGPNNKNQRTGYTNRRNKGVRKSNGNIMHKIKEARANNNRFELMALRFNLKERIEEKNFDFEVLKAELQLLQHCWKMVPFY